MKQTNIQSFFLTLLLVLSLCFSQGFARNLHTFQKEGNSGVVQRMMIELMDYGEPGANTNPKNRFVFTPSPSSSPPSPIFHASPSPEGSLGP
ncbi:hypothetical protein ACHQM5_008560 [Ranunculus cassubicifolius]